MRPRSRSTNSSTQAGLAAVLLRQEKFRQLQIDRRGDLHVARRTHHHMDRPSTALDQRGFIRAHEPVRSRFIERLLEQAKAKPLRRLRQHHALTRDRRNHDGAIGRPVHLLHGVDRGHAGNRSLILLHRLDYTQDRVLVNEGPHRIVHQNDVVVGRVDGRQRIGHGILPVLSALHHTNWFLQFLFFDLLLKARGFVLAQCHHDLADRRALRELAQRMEENWSSVQLKKLLALALWTSGSAGHARTQSGCGNDDDDLHVGERSINAGPKLIQIGSSAPLAKRQAETRLQDYSGLCVSGTTTAAAGGDATFRKSGRGSMGRGATLMLRSSNLPKIIFPAVVWSTDVTEISMFLPIILRALSTTTMVPSSR